MVTSLTWWNGFLCSPIHSSLISIFMYLHHFPTRNFFILFIFRIDAHVFMRCSIYHIEIVGDDLFVFR